MIRQLQGNGMFPAHWQWFATSSTVRQDNHFLPFPATFGPCEPLQGSQGRPNVKEAKEAA